MNVAFPVMAGAMVLLGGLFIVWPWLRRAEAPQAGLAASGSGATWLLLPVLVVATLGSYAWVGSPQTWLTPAVLAAAPARPDASPPGPADTEGQVGAAQIEAMVQRLAQRLEGQPDDAGRLAHAGTIL
ncbi:MAG: hypothetical protein QM742_06645 [Aquabacterium sp.]